MSQIDVSRRGRVAILTLKRPGKMTVLTAAKVSAVATHKVNGWPRSCSWKHVLEAYLSVSTDWVG